MDAVIVEATTPPHFESFAELVSEYVGWLYQRYSDIPWLIDGVGSQQALGRELANLAAAYGPPAGKTFLAVVGGETAGGGAYRDLHDGACEMKRLFVREKFQGRGIGRQLCASLVATAKSDGYRFIRLDTGDRNSEAVTMYESMGFRPCPPYHEYPGELLAHLQFMEMPLAT
jgi:GNAT superfamily N-acetyltransferase